MKTVVSEEFVESIREKFFMEPRFRRAIGSYNYWDEISRPIQPREIQSHFKGSYYVAFVVNGRAVDFFGFDLDCHTLKTKKNLKYRFDLLVEKFEKPHLIVRSPGTGLHLYYFLDKPYSPVEISSYLKQNIKFRSGEIEFIPNGKALRLFGGKDSPLLDYNLKPVSTVPSQIEEYFGKIIDHTPTIELGKLISIQPKRAPLNFERECEELINFGLMAQSSRNDALLKLSRYLQYYKNYSPEETKSFLYSWIKEKHNNFSKDWTLRPKTVLRQIDGIIARYDESKILGKTRISFPTLNLTPAGRKRIHEVAIQVAERTGTDLYKVKAFMEDLISYCRLHYNDGIVEIPHRVFKQCRYGSGTRYTKIKKELLESGTLTVKVSYSANNHKCIKYSILKDFIRSKSEHT